MRVLLAGATGAIGRRIVPRLGRAGHTVIGLTRSPDKADRVRELGAEPVVADALDEGAIMRAVQAARPDAIVHELTDLSGASDLRRFDSTFANSNRLRTTGTDHLLKAARTCGVKRIVAQSYCGWPYARTGAHIKTEEDALDPTPPAQMRRTLDAIRYLEHAVTTSATPDGIALRYGSFYASDSGMFEPAFVDQVRRRRVPLIGDGGAWWSFVHLDDAADATVAALEHGRPGIYNIVDDDPAPVREWLPEFARMLGAKPPLHVPAWLAWIVAGEHPVVMMTQSRAGSNAKARRELSWQPGHPSWRDGFAAITRR